MPRRYLAVAALAAAFAAGAVLQPADAQARPDAPQAGVKKQAPKKRAVRAPRPGGQIACTEFGCRRIPANCYPTQGYCWDGLPSGYDVIVCR